MTRLLIILAILSGCTCSMSCTADQSPPVDPTGVWATTLTWSPLGSCGVIPTTFVTATVARVGNTYAIDESARQVTGFVSCSHDYCSLSLVETGAPGGSIRAMRLLVNLTVDDADEITGSGSAMLTLSDGSMCTNTFSAAGHIKRGL